MDVCYYDCVDLALTPWGRHYGLAPHPISLEEIGKLLPKPKFSVLFAPIAVRLLLNIQQDLHAFIKN